MVENHSYVPDCPDKHLALSPVHYMANIHKIFLR